jgi:hypothetical protein
MRGVVKNKAALCRKSGDGRLVERLMVMYGVGTAVEILLDGVWLPGVVIRHENPAVWVQTADGRAWFVTNRQRIRAASGK